MAVLRDVVEELTEPGAVGREQEQIVLRSAAGVERERLRVRRYVEVRDLLRALVDHLGFADRPAVGVEGEPIDRVGGLPVDEGDVLPVFRDRDSCRPRGRAGTADSAGPRTLPVASSIGILQRFITPLRLERK